MTEDEELLQAQKRYRRLSKPVCPKCDVECLCQRTKSYENYKVQYRYCPICGHPEHKIIPK